MTRTIGVHGWVSAGRARPCEVTRQSSRAARDSLAADLAPALLVDLDAELFRRRLDVFPGFVALAVGDALDLIEAGDRVADVGRVLERLLALLGERKLTRVDGVAVLGVELGHGGLLIE